jgi:hypothetical protein
MLPRLLSLIVALTLLSGQARAQERVWSLDATGEDAFLVYGVPESDDVGISIWCKIGTGKTSLFFPVTWAQLKNEENIPVDVNLGTTEFKLSGKVTSGATLDGSSIEAEIPTSSTFYEAVKSADRIRLTVGAHKSVFPLADAEIDSLLRLCHQSAAAEQQ